MTFSAGPSGASPSKFSQCKDDVGIVRKPFLCKPLAHGGLNSQLSQAQIIGALTYVEIVFPP